MTEEKFYQIDPSFIYSKYVLRTDKSFTFKRPIYTYFRFYIKPAGFKKNFVLKTAPALCKIGC